METTVTNNVKLFKKVQPHEDFEFFGEYNIATRSGLVDLSSAIFTFGRLMYDSYRMESCNDLFEPIEVRIWD